MKKKLMMLIAVLFLGFTAACEDPYREMESEELIELPATGSEEDDEEAKPGDNESNTGG